MRANQYGPCLPWTPEQDRIILALWGKFSLAEIGRQTGMGRSRTATRCKALGLTAPPFQDVLTPPYGEWLARATQAAQEGGTTVGAVMAGSQAKAAKLARWKAWKAVLDADPRYSIAGLARTTGFDHTSILYAVKKMAQKRGYSRQPAYRTSFAASTRVAHSRNSSPAGAAADPAARSGQ